MSHGPLPTSALSPLMDMICVASFAPTFIPLESAVHPGLSPCPSPSTKACHPPDPLSFAIAALISRAAAQLTGFLIRLEKLQPKGVMVGQKKLIPSMVSTRSNWQLALGRV